MQEQCKQNSLISLFIMQKDYKSLQSMQPSRPLSVGEGRGLNLQPNFQKEGSW